VCTKTVGGTILLVHASNNHLGFCMGGFQTFRFEHGWVKASERFEQRSDGDGLCLSYRASPKWLFRYRFGGKQRVMNLGSYTVLSLAVVTLRELCRLANGSPCVFPARKMQSRRVPHIDLNTLNAALAKRIKPMMADIPHFTIHDFRRTARTLPSGA
jgi:hypothetical protein